VENEISANILAEKLGLQSKTGAFKRTLQDLLKQEQIEYTLPDKPSSRLQKYRLTAKGHAILKQLKKENQ
jgi:ATP-dependent DNA helicase RecG